MPRKRPVDLQIEQEHKPFTHSDYKHVKKQLKAQIVDGKGRKRGKRTGPKKPPTEKQLARHNNFKGVVAKAQEYKLAEPTAKWQDCMKRSFQFQKSGTIEI